MITHYAQLDKPPVDFIDIVRDGVIAPFVTFTRASTATYFDANGVMQTAAANTPRLDHDPVTKVLKGLLIEEQRTNLITRSTNYSSSPWIKLNCVVEVGVAAAPDGTMTADRLRDDATLGYHSLSASTGVTDGAVYWRTVRVKKDTARYVGLGVASSLSSGTNSWIFDLDTGVFTITGTSGVGQRAVQLSDGWWELSLGNVANTGFNNRLAVFVVNGPARTDAEYAGTGALSVFVWGAQFESGAFPTSYIPTTNAAVTRAGDVLLTTNLNALRYNPGAGTMMVEGEYAHDRQLSYGRSGTLLFRFYNGLSGFTNQIVAGRQTGKLNVSFRDAETSGVDCNVSTSVSPIMDRVFSAAVAWQQGYGVVLASSGSLYTEPAPNTPVFNATGLHLTRAYDASIFTGWKKNVRYYPRRLSNQELQEITAP